jgi:hypothetical protein
LRGCSWSSAISLAWLSNPSADLRLDEAAEEIEIKYALFLTAPKYNYVNPHPYPDI